MPPGLSIIRPAKENVDVSMEANAAPRGKPHYLAPRKSKKYRAPFPGAARVHSRVDDSAAARSIYHGRDRVGSYRRLGDCWLAVDRLGRPLGQFESEHAAVDAISARGGR